MENKNEIFFGENGLTSTSANHIANMAKELYQGLEIELANLKFYSTGVNLIGAPVTESSLLETGTNEVTLSQVKDKLNKVAQLKSLIAWLREAIKGREALKLKLSCMTLADFCELKGIEYPKMEDVKMGEITAHILTEEEYYAGLSLKERNRYYELETMASTIGQYIHQHGTLSVQREELKNKIEKPTKVNENGRDTLIYTYCPTVSTEAVDEVFFDLQNLHREYQKQLNSMKFECENAIQKSKTEYVNEAQAVNIEYSKNCAIASEKYRSEIDKVTCEFSVYTNNENTRISKLKIVIPDSLREIYDFVNSYGEKKK